MVKENYDTFQIILLLYKYVLCYLKNVAINKIKIVSDKINFKWSLEFELLSFYLRVPLKNALPPRIPRTPPQHPDTSHRIHKISWSLTTKPTKNNRVLGKGKGCEMSTSDQAANSTPSSPVDPGPDFLVVPDPTAFGERRGSKVRVSTITHFQKLIFYTSICFM